MCVVWHVKLVWNLIIQYLFYIHISQTTADLPLQAFSEMDDKKPEDRAKLRNAKICETTVWNTAVEDQMGMQSERQILRSDRGIYAH